MKKGINPRILNSQRQWDPGEKVPKKTRYQLWFDGGIGGGGGTGGGNCCNDADGSKTLIYLTTTH